MRVLNRVVLIITGLITAGLAGGVLWFVAPRGPASPGSFEPAALVRAEVERLYREGDSVYQEVRLESADGFVHRALIRLPYGVEGPLIAVTLVGGIDSSRRCVEYPPDTEKPILWAAIDYPYELPDKGSLWTYARELPLASDRVERMVAGLRLLLDYLEGRDDVDPGRTLICGGSLGGFPAVIAAAMEPRYEGVVILNSGADLEGIVAANFRFDPPWMRRMAARMLRPWLGPFEPEQFVERISPRPFLQIHGTEDRMISPERATLLFEAAEEPKEMLWLEMPHVITGSDLLTRDMEATLLAWMEREGL
jgi:fermentation-respiration switch protein FrsA (DUF1100 family)